MADFKTIKVPNEKLLDVAKKIVSGRLNDDLLSECIHGLLIDNDAARDRIMGSMMGILPDFSKGIKKGDTVKIKKGRYFVDDYDIDKCLDEGLLLNNPDDNDYYKHFVIAKIEHVRPMSETITFDVVGKLLTDEGVYKAYSECLPADSVELFESI
jgi:hypothetical protein